ncbi:methylisocitrate lyase, partial [Shewanella sp. 0m-11]
TEFGQTELWNKEQLGEWGASMVLYPLSAFRAMNKAAEMVYSSILENGDQKAVVDSMQTRMDLYDYLGYHDYEQKLDSLFAEGKNL